MTVIRIKTIVLGMLILIITSCIDNSKSQKKELAVITEIKHEAIKSDPLTTDGVLQLMKKTSQWQIDNLPNTMVLPSGIIEPLTTHNWVRATFLSGMMAYYDLTKSEETFNYVSQLCKKVNYELGDRPRHADEFAIGRVYTDIYLKTQDKGVLKDMFNRIDAIIENPTRGTVEGWENEKNWAWCDALFMAPPAWLKLYTCTGKRKYLNEMDKRYWETYDHLYSKSDSLFYRDARFIWDDKGKGVKTKNGKKVFWGRGNGWVLGGLTDQLTYIPGDFHHRGKYTQLFKEMVAKIASLQGEDGMWRSSLLDFEEYPTKEFSASAFFCYAMAWGVNHQVLNKEIYWPKIQKAWIALIACIQKDGKIGYVQKVGADPQSVSENDTMEYATGAFLLCGKEIYEIVSHGKSI